MNEILCKMVVDKKLYDEYQGKKYRIGREEYPLRTIEIMANSKDYDAYPHLKAQAQGVVEQIQKEIKEYYSRKDGRGEYTTMRHNTFSEYLADLQEIHAKVAPERMELEEKWKQAQKRWQEDQREFKGDERYLARQKVKYLDEEETYKNHVKELQRRTQEEIQAVQSEYERHVVDFYSANGNRLDDGMVRLLNSGIKLTDSEIDGMVSQNTGNPTMLRLISDHCEKHGIENQNARVFGSVARKAGADERKAFKVVADMVKKAVSENETTSSVWSKEDSHFKRLSDEQIGAMSSFYVKPMAPESADA